MSLTATGWSGRIGGFLLADGWLHLHRGQPDHSNSVSIRLAAIEAWAHEPSDQRDRRLTIQTGTRTYHLGAVSGLPPHQAEVIDDLAIELAEALRPS